MTIAIFLIIILTTAIWILNKVLSRKICSICAGVSLTWLFMLLGIYFGKLSAIDYQQPVAILAGGTVVGLMSKLETLIKVNWMLFWKTVFVLSGFTAVYGLIAFDWKAFSVGAIFTILFTLMFKTGKVDEQSQKSAKLKELEEKMKNCC